jgi:hypothetical protein
MGRTLAVLAFAVLGAVLAVVAGPAEVARGEEMKTPIGAPTLLMILSRPIEPRADALDRSLREDGPPPVAEPAGEILPDGSVRYGRVTITVKNPCPPGTVHYEPPPLPGRRSTRR